MSKVTDVLVVGGGTAGWLAAAYLAKQRGSRVNVTLVESPDIKTIGVGEGTWPTMRTTLQNLGISETRFLRECQATFKQASKFVNWKNDPKVDGENFYYHLFDAPSFKWDFSPVPYWLAGAAGSDVAYADAVSLQERVCQHNLAPKLMVNKEYEGLLHYAYHLDAGRFANLLKEVATQELGVNYIQANVTDVTLAENGDIHSVITDQAGEITADLFIDCSGFKSLLLGEKLGVEFVDYDDVLFIDRAVTIQVPYESPDAPIASHTISTAQEAGWIWDIGLTERRGVGYVYSSRHTTDEQAEQVLRDYLGKAADDKSARRIPIKVGRRDKMWKNNCLAIGLSGAFMEPLEASAIFLIEAACYMLTDFFPEDRESMNYVAQQFNQSFAFRWDKVVEFIKLHYVLSGRDDSAFWRDNKDPKTIPPALQQRLAHWQNHIPSKYEFSSVFEPFTKESYEFILMGMSPLNSSQEKVDPSLIQKAKDNFAAIQKAWPEAEQTLLTNRELLNRIKKHQFHNV